MEKSTALFFHAKRRLRERYGEDLTHEYHDRIIEKIGNKKFLGKKITCRKFLVKVEVDGKVLYTVYDRKRNTIITFLTKEMFIRSTQ